MGTGKLQRPLYSNRLVHWPLTGGLLHFNQSINLLAQKHDRVTCATKQSEQDSKDTDAPAIEKYNYSEGGGAWRAAARLSPLLALPNVTAHTSTTSVPTLYYSMLHYNCLCTIGPKGLITQEHSQRCFELHLKFCIFTRQLFFKMLQSKLQYYSINILKLSNTDVFNVTHLRADRTCPAVRLVFF